MEEHIRENEFLDEETDAKEFQDNRRKSIKRISSRNEYNLEEISKYPHIVNLNEDPMLSKKIMFNFEKDN